MGFLYNEWFSLSCKMMSPYWLNTIETFIIEEASNDETLELISKPGSVGYVYQYGIDPGIKLAANGFPTENSVKMKLAIILGLAHVVFGLLLSLWNYLYFRKYYPIFLHFLPKLLFILCIYGYLVYLIFYKWLYPMIFPRLATHSNADIKKMATTDFRPYLPNLRDEFLHYVLWAERAKLRYRLSDFKHFLGFEPKQFKYDAGLLRSFLYHIALACFPVMLFGSPIYLYIKNRMELSRIEKQKNYRPYQMRGQDSEELKKHQEFSLGQHLLHRLWRTMEFGLAVVSHMASYLRLWALSMAHTLLSDFLWHETMRKLAIRDHTEKGIWKLYLVFFLWALITLFFLVIMDSLAVFIHALRLHWIEFMSKFFKGDGVPFRPFALSTVLDERDVKREEETAAIARIRRARESAGDYY